jgi:cytochrome c oxidase subunit 2
VTNFARRRWMVPLIIALFSALILPAVAFAQAPSPLSPASPGASDIASLHNLIMAIAVVIFVIVEGLLLYSVFRFRRRSDSEMPRQIYGSVPVEIAWTVAPAIIVLILMFLTFRTMRTVAEPPPSNTVHVQVVGHQWWWEFRYPDLGIVTANELHVPVGEVVRFELESADVIHSFWVPQLAGKTDAIPGRKTQTWFRADAPGTYQGQCAEFCGAQHGQMRFQVIAEPQETFDAWAEQQAAGPVEVTGELAQQGQDLFFQSACVGCHTIQGTQAQGQTGPNLTHVGSRQTIVADLLENTPENMARWIHNPQEVKPDNLMPNLNLTQEEVDALVAYLQSLK